MTVEIKAPTFPESVADGVVSAWHKQPGERVAREWGFKVALLHVYAENRGAVRAYEKNGYATLRAPFRTPYDVLRGRTKLLMAKRI